MYYNNVLIIKKQQKNILPKFIFNIFKKLQFFFLFTTV